MISDTHNLMQGIIMGDNIRVLIETNWEYCLLIKSVYYNR